MNFRKVNNITGWLVFLIALATYMLTREARGSLWDCGEFVSCAYKQQMPHPPGAPLFVMLGRLFIVLFGNTPLKAANAVNIMSAVASAATILFLFWTITHFARKLFVKVGEEMNGQQIFTVMSAGTVGALAYTFTDSFWFSAVEGEVYALSSFFTALAFWVMLKWEHADEKAGNNEFNKRKADRWIVFLFFSLGLSIGVHLLGLLTIPAVVMIYYYRRFKPTRNGAIIAFLIGCAITGIVQLGVIQYSMKSAGLFDVFFVNTVGLPFFSGFTIYFLALAAVLAWALFFTEKTISKSKLITWFILFLALFTLPFFTTTGSVGIQIVKFLLIAGIGAVAGFFFKPAALKTLKLGVWSFAFMMVGYLMYITVLIRSTANPVIDMNDVDNPMNLVYYLGREQYGSAPLIYGPHFAARPVDIKEGEMKYVQGKSKYIPIGKEKSYEYASEDKQFFPRVWDPSNDQYHADFYADWLNIPAVRDPQTGQEMGYEAPTYGDNINWFFTYQLGFMYWRYFMWNFAGRQNDVQGYGNKRDGNWISGISFIDNKRLGDQSQMPESLKKNKARNTLYLLPFLLGIFGCVYQFLKNRKDWIVNFLLFFFTGIAIVLYLNQPGMQPRERDYAYAGSFYAYAVWIGLAVVGFVRLAKDVEDKKTFQNTLIYGGILSFLIALMSGFPGGFNEIFVSSAMIAALYVIIAAAIIYIVRAISSGGKNSSLLNISTAAICMITPVIMAQQEWDDHDRSKKTLAPDIARDYLESCAPNAVLFTFGDNDTYPLWYAQEVEGVRPDIRIINNSLLGIDWYINQLRYKVNNADSLDVIWTPEQIEGHNREYLRYQQEGDANQYYNLYNIMKDKVGKPYLDPETKRDVGPNYFPVSRVFIPVDTALVRSNGTVNPDDSVVERVAFEIPQRTLRGIQRNDLIMLNIIAANGWKRPIYFTSLYGELGFGQYLRKDGKSYRLVPVENKYPQANWVVDQELRKIRFLGSSTVRDNNLPVIYKNLKEKFEFGGANIPGVYFDEENRRHLLDLRSTYGEAAGNLADAGKKEEAQELLDICEKMISTENLPYAQASRYNSHNQTSLVFLEACYKAGKKELAEKVRAALRKDFDQQKKYYEYIRTERPELFGGYERSEYPANNALITVLDALENKYAPELKNQNTNETPQGLNLKPDSTGTKDSMKKPK
jgi:drug/metabolite transporter (DMT)-like permease